MPSWTAVFRRAEIWSIWPSLSRAPARLIFRPSASPNQRWVSASVMRVIRLSRIWTRRGRSAGYERAVAGDHLFGVDGFIPHGGIDVAVPGDELSDVRWHPVHDRIGDEQPPEIVEGIPQWPSGGVLDPDHAQRV